MATPKPLLPSLLDRLFDDEPHITRDPPPLRALEAARATLRDVKKSLRRDLEALLNSRVRNVVWGDHLQQLNGSLLDYGLPDFGHINLVGEAERAGFCRQLEDILRTHEPRLSAVRVESLTREMPIDRTFHFQIHALLQMDPAPEPITFDSVLRPTTGNFKVEGAAG